MPYLAFQPNAMSDTPILPISEVTTSYYLRMQVADQAGVLAAVTGICIGCEVYVAPGDRRERDKKGFLNRLKRTVRRSMATPINAEMMLLEADLMLAGAETELPR